VTFEDTNVAGNVYFINHLKWQGRCRELFLHEHVPELLARLNDDLALVTVRCTCEYLGELFVFDEVIVRMRLGELTQGRVSMRFEYLRVNGSATPQLIATGEQETACMRRADTQLYPAPWPPAFVRAVERFTAAAPAVA
jgi:enediyne biosynthesis thioesterase